MAIVQRSISHNSHARRFVRSLDDETFACLARIHDAGLAGFPRQQATFRVAQATRFFLDSSDDGENGGIA
jgi:hypothetical protein